MDKHSGRTWLLIITHYAAGVILNVNLDLISITFHSFLNFFLKLYDITKNGNGVIASFLYGIVFLDLV